MVRPVRKGTRDDEEREHTEDNMGGHKDVVAVRKSGGML